MKLLSISELENGSATDPIWVLNMSATSEVGQAGEVNIGIPKLNGTKIDPLHVPQTWLPQEVTSQVPRAQLLGCSEFRQAVSKGLIGIIAPEEAATLLKQEGAEEEQERLAEYRRHIKQAGAARTLTSSAAEIGIVTVGGDNGGDEAAGEISADSKPGLNPAFVMFAETLNPMTDIQALNAIKSRRRFQRRELQHLKANLNDKPKTIKAIVSLLDTMKANASEK